MDLVSGWRKDDGVVLGRVYSIQKEDLDRTSGLYEDNLIIPVQLCGDCLYRYHLIKKLRRSSFKLVEGKLIECYPIGVPYELQPNEREHQKLMLGERTGFSYGFDISEEYKAAISETLLEMDRSILCIEQMMKRRKCRKI